LISVDVKEDSSC